MRVTMLLPLLLPLLLLLVLLIPRGRSDFVADEEKLRNALLTNYTTKVRPRLKTYIYVAAFLSSLNSLDIASQSMSVNLILISAWNDQRLVWNSSDYNGLEALVTAPEDVWTPPLVIENSVTNIGVVGGKDRDATPVRVLHTGHVSWSPPTQVTVSCEMLIAHYPFDTQACSIVIIGWTYPLSEMDIVLGPVDTFLYNTNGEFDLVNTSLDTKNIGGPKESETYKKVFFKLTFRRKWQFYGQNLLLPIVLNSVLMNAVFLLPIDCGEKMGYSLTVLLSYTVFLTWVTENLPPVSTDTSILQVYLAVVLCLGCFATAMTIWILRLYHQPPDKPLSTVYISIATHLLIPLRDCTCLRKPQSRKKGANSDNALARMNQVFPRNQQAQGGQLTHRRPEFGDLKVTEFDGHPQKDGAEVLDQQDKRGSGRDAWESTEPAAALTWQEFAALMDGFLFGMFACLLVILTTVIFSLMYANY